MNAIRWGSIAFAAIVSVALQPAELRAQAQCPEGTTSGMVLSTGTVSGARVLSADASDFKVLPAAESATINGRRWTTDDYQSVVQILGGQTVQNFWVTTSLVYVDAAQFDADTRNGQQYSPVVLAQGGNRFVVAMLDKDMRRPQAGAGARAISISVMGKTCQKRR
ncbi:MAG: hypothetical protein ACT4O6_13995 [Reyranella sp.]